LLYQLYRKYFDKRIDHSK